jgi:hypothetical protein
LNPFDKTIDAGTVRGKPTVSFLVFKYIVYALLVYNIFFFFQEDLKASAITFGGDVGWGNVIAAYSGTVDTAAWVLLLLLLELETAIIRDAYLNGPLKWVLPAVRCFAYFFIVSAFFGYLNKHALISGAIPFSIDDVCSLIGTDYTYVEDLDDYRAIDRVSCGLMRKATLLEVVGTHIIGTVAIFEDAARQALADIINSACWLVIVVLLEIEILLHLAARLTDKTFACFCWVKSFFYGILLLCALYWWSEGDFLDFWDAFLWLFAFILIELNVYRWRGSISPPKTSKFYPLGS